MTPRIVLATDSPDPSGLGEHMLTLGTALGSAFDVTVLAPVGAAGEALLARAARRGLRIKAMDFERPGHLRSWLRAFAPDLVHVHAGIGWEGHGLVRAASGAGVPVVRTEHLPYLLTDVVQQAEYRAMLLSVDRRIAVSEAVARSHGGMGRGPIGIVRNGIEPLMPAVPRDAVRQTLGLGNTDKLVLTVARLTAQKGHDVLLGAVPDVLDSHPETRFVLVGDGPERVNLEEAIAARGLGENVMMLGGRSDVADLLAAADLFVLPSHFEGLSLALLEAMAAGLPVVATDTGSNGEALGRQHPMLVTPGDAPALARSIIEALDDPQGTAAAADAARQRFDAGFTSRRMAQETAEIYRTVLSNAEGAAA